MKKLIVLFALLATTISFSFAQYWNISGNQNNNSNRLGTVNHCPITFITSDSVRMTLSEDRGFLGIGTSTPQQLLHIHSNTSSLSSSNSNVNLKNKNIFSSNAAIRLTNDYTGITVNRGASINLINENLSISLLESGNITFNNGLQNTLSLNNKNNVLIGDGHTNKAKLSIRGVYDSTSLLISYPINDTASCTSLKIENNNSTQCAISCILAPYTGSKSRTNFKVMATGYVYAREINVQIDKFPDYVFDDDYQLLSYEDLREYIKVNKHLPKIPKATEVSEKGLDLGEANRLLTEKVEELYLYILDLEERIKNIEE